MIEDGCLAAGGGRGAVVTGTYLAEAIHRLALWVGGLSTVGAICTLRRRASTRTGQDGGPANVCCDNIQWRSTDELPK